MSSNSEERDRSLRRLFAFRDRIHPERKLSQTEMVGTKAMVSVAQESPSQNLPLWWVSWHCRVSLGSHSCRYMKTPG